MTAAEAHRVGMVNQVVPREKLPELAGYLRASTSCENPGYGTLSRGTHARE